MSSEMKNGVFWQELDYGNFIYAECPYCQRPSLIIADYVGYMDNCGWVCKSCNREWYSDMDGDPDFKAEEVLVTLEQYQKLEKELEGIKAELAEIKKFIRLERPDFSSHDKNQFIVGLCTSEGLAVRWQRILLGEGVGYQCSSCGDIKEEIPEKHRLLTVSSHKHL